MRLIATAGTARFSGFLGSLVMDRFAIYFYLLFLMGAAVAILMSVRYMEIEQEDHGEYYALILFAVVGMMCMAAGFDLILLFVGLELMALSTYVLVGFLRRDKRSNEAALKYLLLGAFSSGIFAYGLSLFYGITGSTNIGEIADKLAVRIAQQPARSHRDARADHHRDRLALQDRRGAFPSVGARCLRRRTDGGHRLHVRGREGRGLGDAAAYLPLHALADARRSTRQC